MKRLLSLIILMVVGAMGQQPDSLPTVPGPLSVFVNQEVPIPQAFFGMISNRTYPINLPYGNWRSWDSQTQWVNLEICLAASGDPNDPCFKWDELDTDLSIVYSQGVTDGVLATLSRTPGFAVDLNADPTGRRGKGCNYYNPNFNGTAFVPGQCLLPVDLNADGSGANKIWKNWVTAFATHVSSPTYLKTHAHVEWYEPWNEVHRSTTIVSPPYTGVLSYEGTFAQLVRLTEDLRCIVLGKGTIHNFPTAGKSTPCTSKAIDGKAKIASPSLTFPSANQPIMLNFLYCTNNPPVGSQCTTGNAGSDAVDGINTHMYAVVTTPEIVSQQRMPYMKSVLTHTDNQKPLINGEFSWGSPSDGSMWTDVYAQAGFIPRVFALYWTYGVTLNYWYAYDQGACCTGGLSNGTTLYHPQSDAWIQTVNWLAGSTQVYDQFCQQRGTIFTCDLITKDNKEAELIWDSEYGQNCSDMSQPLICGNTSYPVPKRYQNFTWVDLLGASHPLGQTVTIGANPILLMGGDPGKFPRMPEAYNLTVGVTTK